MYGSIVLANEYLTCVVERRYVAALYGRNVGRDKRKG